MTGNLRISVIQHHPWIQLINGNDCKGILCELLKHLSNSLNFSYNFIEIKEGYGIKGSNKKWTGHFGLLQKNVIILCLIFG